MSRRRSNVVAETTVADRRARVAALYLQGCHQSDIARELKKGQATISRDLAFLREEWRASAARDFGERQAEELAKLDQIEREAWAAWQQSKRDAVVTSAEKLTTGTGKRTGERSKAAKKVEHRDGNPMFLALVKQCLDKRCEILGIDAPKRFETRVEFPDLRTVPDDQLRRLDVVLAEALASASLPPAASGPGGAGPPG